LADARALGARGNNPVRVQISPPAHIPKFSKILVKIISFTGGDCGRQSFTSGGEREKRGGLRGVLYW
jgi:hypothetical protein